MLKEPRSPKSVASGTMSPCLRRRGGRDTAAATVVGALLALTLVVVALMIFRTSFVPALEEDAEERSMADTARSMLELRANLDSHVGDQRPGRLSVPVSTSSEASVPLAPAPPDDDLRTRSGTSSVTVHAPNATTWMRNGTLLVRENPDWQTIPGQRLEIKGVEEVLDLRFRFASVSAAEAGESFSVRIIGSGAGFQGQVTYTIQEGKGPDQAQIIAEVENADHEIVFRQTIETVPEAQSDYEIDVMDHLVAFDHVMETARKPMHVVFVDNSVGAERAMTYRVRDASTETEIVEPGGGVTGTVHETFDGGALRYEAHNSYFVDQRYEIEHGALLLHQGNLSTVKGSPHAPAGVVESGLLGDRVKASFGLPLVTGEDRSMAGADTVSVTTETRRRTGVSALASQASLNVTTTAPGAWASWARTHYEDEGLSAADGEFSVDRGDDWVNVTVHGRSLLDSVDDVHLDLQTAHVETVLER